MKLKISNLLKKQEVITLLLEAHTETVSLSIAFRTISHKPKPTNEIEWF